MLSEISVVGLSPLEAWSLMSDEEKKGRGRRKSFDHVVHVRLTPADLRRVKELGEGATDTEKIRDLIRSALILRAKKSKRLKAKTGAAEDELPDTQED